MSQTRTDQSGVAMITALFAVAILGGLAVLFVATSVNQLRFTQNEREWERALPTGEAGIDHTILELNQDKDFYGNPAADPSTSQVPVYDPNDPPEDERAWAIDMTDGEDPGTAEDPGAFTLTDVADGQVGAFRPRPPNAAEGGSFEPELEDCEDPEFAENNQHICGVNAIFAVGYIPDRATALAGDGEIRVVRIDYTQARFKPTHALASGGNCDMTSGEVRGEFSGDVYCDNDIADGVRGDYDPILDWGNTAKVEGKLTATGDIDPDPAIRAESCNFEDSCANGTVGEFEERATHQQLPSIDVRDFYSLNHELPRYDNTDGDPAPYWFDLCPPGTPDVRATIRAPSSSPCTGDLVWTDGVQTNNYNGWDWSGNAGKWKGKSITSGAYYVYQANADSQGGSGDVTVFVQADHSDDGDTGSWDMQGNIDVQPAVGDGQLLFLADRDISMNGNSGSSLDGFIAAHEQIDARGSATLKGSIYAEDAPHTPDSPIGETDLSGSMTIDYDHELSVPLSGIVRITAWQEL